MKKIIIIFILFIPVLSWCKLSNFNPEFSSFGARYAGMGNSGIALINGNEAILHNPAGLLNNVSDLEFSVENVGQLGLVNHTSIGLSIKKSSSYAWAGALLYSGDEALSELTSYFSFAASYNEASSIFSHLPKKLNLGMNLKYFGKFFGNNKSGSYYDVNDFNHQVSGSAHGFGVDIGMQYQYSAKQHFGLFMHNIISGIWWESDNEIGSAGGSYQENKPHQLYLGYGYQTPKVNFTADYRPTLSSDTNSNLSFGIEYHLFSNLMNLLGGYSKEILTGENEKISFGTGISHKINKSADFQLNIAYQIISAWQGHNNLLISCSIRR